MGDVSWKVLLPPGALRPARGTTLSLIVRLGYSTAAATIIEVAFHSSLAPSYSTLQYCTLDSSIGEINVIGKSTLLEVV